MSLLDAILSSLPSASESRPDARSPRPRLTPARLKDINVAWTESVLARKHDSPRRRRIRRKAEKRYEREQRWIEAALDELIVRPEPKTGLDNSLSHESV